MIKAFKAEIWIFRLLQETGTKGNLPLRLFSLSGPERMLL